MTRMVEIIKSEFSDPTQDRDLKIDEITSTQSVASSSDELLLSENPGGDVISVNVLEDVTSDVPEDKQNIKVYQQRGGGNQIDVRAVNTDDTSTELDVKIEIIYLE